MPPQQIKFNAQRHGFDIDGRLAVEISRDDAVVAPLEVLRDVTVTSLESALTDYETQDGATVNYVFLSDVPSEIFDADTSPKDVALSFIMNRVSTTTAHGVDASKPEVDIETLVGPLLARHEAEMTGSFLDDQEGHVSRVASFRLLDRDRPVADLYSLAIEAQALIDAAAGTGQITASSARDLLKAGLAQALFGQPEALWIDAKVEPHELSTDAGKWEFAKDIAAFANTGEDALIAYGLGTSKKYGADIITDHRAFKLERLDNEQAWGVLNARLTPTISDLEFGTVELKGGYGYGWVFVPAQQPYVLPILVTGMLEGTKVRGTHISAPFRTGEHTTHWDASTLHGLIQAGRVALSQASITPGQSISAPGVSADERPKQD